MMPRASAVAAILALAGCAGGTGPGAEGLRGASFVLLTLDTTRADRLGFLDYPRARTPVLDRLASRGLVFENAAAQTPLTLPSHASILTGLYPTNHGVRNNGTHRLEPEHETLAEILGRSGYATAAAVAAFVLDRKFGLAQGFDRYDDAVGGESSHLFGYAERRGAAVTDAALALAEELPEDGPFFLWLHYFDPHAPYDPPAGMRGSDPSPAGRYDDEIAAMDREIGRLLEGLARRGRLDHTLIAVVSDHGEGVAGPHAEKSHGIFLYEETMRCAMVLATWRGLAAPGRSRVLARQVDLVPTVLDLLGVPAPADLDGRSLARLVRGEPLPQEPLSSYAETFFPLESFGWSPLFQIRTARWKYVEAPTPELYDLENDPLEARNVALERPEIVRSLAQELARIRAEARYPDHRSGTRSVSASDAQKLVALGYTEGGGTADPAAWSALRDPKEWIELHERLESARQALLAGRAGKAIKMLDQVLARDPDNFEAIGLLATCRLAEQDLAGAEQALVRLTEKLPSAAHHHVRLGGVRQQRAAALRAEGRDGRAQELEQRAIESFERAIELGSRDVAPFVNTGVIELRRGNFERAAVRFEEAVEIDPASYAAHYNLGVARLRAGRYEEAERALAAAQPLAGDDAGRRVRLGHDRVEVAIRLERWEEAARRLDGLLANFPEDPGVERWRALRREVEKRRTD